MGDRCEVYVDGGFSNGAHIFKALALGARMVSGFLRYLAWVCAYSQQLLREKHSNMLLAEVTQSTCLLDIQILKVTVHMTGSSLGYHDYLSSAKKKSISLF